MSNYTNAQYWIDKASEETYAAEGTRRLAFAQVYATLAVADVIASALEALAHDLTGSP